MQCPLQNRIGNAILRLETRVSLQASVSSDPNPGMWVFRKAHLRKLRLHSDTGRSRTRSKSRPAITLTPVGMKCPSRYRPATAKQIAEGLESGPIGKFLHIAKKRVVR